MRVCNMTHQSNETEYQVRIDGSPVWYSSTFGQEEIDQWLKTCSEFPNCYVDIVLIRKEILVNQGNYSRMQKHFEKLKATQ